MHTPLVCVQRPEVNTAVVLCVCLLYFPERGYLTEPSFLSVLVQLDWPPANPRNPPALALATWLAFYAARGSYPRPIYAYTASPQRLSVFLMVGFPVATIRS